MGKIFDGIDTKLKHWIGKQKMFFVSTAPLSADGLVNCSPKGLDSFRVVGPREVVYLDLTGSGIETVSHLKENGRIVIMFCSFDSSARIVRLHGKGTVYEKDSSEFERYAALFEPFPSARSVIHVDVRRISDSCGYGVPHYEFKSDRKAIAKWAEQQGAEGLVKYRREKNAYSLEGLPGLDIK